VSRTRNIIRQTARSPTRRVWRALNRAGLLSLPGHHRGRDDLSQTLYAFGHALRCHRRLARLAPRFFDPAVVYRETLERLEHRRWMESWQPLLDKVYGPSRDPAQPPTEPTYYPPPLPGPRTQRAVSLVNGLRREDGKGLYGLTGRMVVRHAGNGTWSFAGAGELAALKFGVDARAEMRRLARNTPPGFPPVALATPTVNQPQPDAASPFVRECEVQLSTPADGARG